MKRPEQCYQCGHRGPPFLCKLEEAAHRFGCFERKVRNEIAEQIIPYWRRPRGIVFTEADLFVPLCPLGGTSAEQLMGTAKRVPIGKRQTHVADGSSPVGIPLEISGITTVFVKFGANPIKVADRTLTT